MPVAFANRCEGSIGNANIQGLSKDLHLTGNEYNW